MAGLTAVLLTSNNALCVLNGNAALCVVHKNDESDEEKEDDDKSGNEEIILGLTAGEVCPKSGYKSGTTGNDTCKQKHGNAVSDTFFINSFAKPHGKHGTGSKHEEDGYYYKSVFPLIIEFFDCIIALEGYIVGISLNKTKTHGGVSGDLIELLSAFGTLFRHLLKCRNCNSEKLNNDGSRNVGRDGKREDGRLRKHAAGEHIQITDKVTGVCIHQSGKSACIKEWDRNR